MYDDKNLIYFFTILEAIEKINLYSKDCKDDEEFYYSNHQMNFNATVNLLIAIGEENKKITQQIKKDFPFKWNDISKMRDKISHNYRGVNSYMIWDIIQNSLLEYKQLLIKILPNIKDFEYALDDALDSEYYMHLDYLKEILK
jgi:uncharacterized protein with HEPN domain